MPPPCSICDALGSDTYVDENSDQFVSGEVFCIVESIATPIEEILFHSNPAGLARLRSDASLKSINSRARATHKSARPCILLRDSLATTVEDIKRPNVCLMATFEGRRMDTLPPILQFFCLAVYPTIPLDDAHVKEEQMPASINAHIHPALPWPCTERCDTDCTQPCDKVHCNQWIITWSFKTKRPLLGRWLTPEAKRERKAGERTGMVFGEYAVAALREHCKTRRKAWINLCRADPTFIMKREKEYREWFKEHDAELARRRCLAQSEASSVSMRSWPRQTHPASIMARSVLSQTIPEENDGAVCEKLTTDVSVGPWMTVDSHHIKKKPSKVNGHTGRPVFRSTHTNAEEHTKRTSMRSNAASVKSGTGSYTSTKNTKLLDKIYNPFSILKLQ